MSAAQIERLQEHLQRLRLFKSRERLEALLQDATAKECSFADFLDQILSEEVASKTAKHVTMRTQLARFPFVKSLDSFDFSYQPSIDRKSIGTTKALSGSGPQWASALPLFTVSWLRHLEGPRTCSGEPTQGLGAEA